MSVCSWTQAAVWGGYGNFRGWSLAAGSRPPEMHWGCRDQLHFLFTLCFLHIGQPLPAPAAITAQSWWTVSTVIQNKLLLPEMPLVRYFTTTTRKVNWDNSTRCRRLPWYNPILFFCPSYTPSKPAQVWRLEGHCTPVTATPGSVGRNHITSHRQIQMNPRH